MDRGGKSIFRHLPIGSQGILVTILPKPSCNVEDTRDRYIFIRSRHQSVLARALLKYHRVI